MSDKQDDFFQLKADFIPTTVLKLKQTDVSGIQTQLENIIKQAPNYLTNAPLIIDANDISADQTLDVKELKVLLETLKIIPVGIRGLNAEQKAVAQASHLPILSTPEKNKKNVKTESAKKTPKTQKETTPTANKSTTKIITKAIRAGTQVYAKGGDLIVLAAVNAGAECVADGNIHIYGPLRGRALAGARGDENARIFCQSLEAELVAIAGHYKVKDDIQVPKKTGNMIQISWQNNQLQISTI